MSRLKDLYNEQIVEAMSKKFGYKNVMEVPKLDKIVINMGVGEAKYLQERRIPSLTSKSEKVWQSDVKRPFAAKKCMISWIVL